jgi:teichuronic acid biosynthesis glycosyltransferase TuaC
MLLEMPSMRIAVVTTSYPAYPGDPSGHFVQAEARALARAHEVAVIAPRHGAAVTDTREGGSLRLHWVDGGDAFGWPGVAARLRERPLRAVGALRWAWGARWALALLGPFDRIVAHWSVPCGWPVAAGTRAELELVSHGADVRALVAAPAPLRGAVVRALATRASAWRFVSEDLLAKLTSRLASHDARRVERIAEIKPCAIEMPDVRARVAERRAEHADKPLYVCVARLVASKRVERAIEHLAPRPAEARLVIVGDGPERERLEALARLHKVDARFVGKLERAEALAWIGAAKALLQTSDSEGLATVVREAEALGVPTVDLAEEQQPGLDNPS